MNRRKDHSQPAYSPPTPKIDPNHESSFFFRGSHSSRLNQRLQVDDKIPDLPPDLKPPEIRPSVPDLAIQFFDPRPEGGCLSEEERLLFKQSLERSLTEMSIDGDVLIDCIESGDTNQPTETVGIWALPALTDRDREARRLGLESLDLLAPDETIALFINSIFVRRLVAEEWENLPKRRNKLGSPDPKGPIYLQDFRLRFERPDRVIFQVRGVDERPWPDVSFTLTFTDTLGIAGLAFVCDSLEPELVTDESWLNYATFALSFLAAFTPLGPLTSGILESALEGSQSTASTGPGCQIASVWFVPSIPIPGGQKIELFYRRAEVSSGGLFSGANISLADREPFLRIVGARQLSSDFRVPSVSSVYRVLGEDLRGNLDIRWTADGEVLSPSSTSTAIRFSIEGAEKGEILNREVSVRIIDEDGLEADARLDVEIRVTDLVDEEIPLPCRAKPWLPQCGQPIDDDVVL